mgnify:CR=1 FL=1
MRKRMFVCFLLIAFFLQSALALDISAKSAILVEASTGTVLFEKGSHVEREIASTTKIMTALVVLQHANPDTVVTVKKACTGIEGSSLYLRPGEKITVRDLLYGLMLRSGNDAAVTLADHVCGDVGLFVKLMNDTAAKLGLSGTHFANPNGLPAEGHYSTAADMSRLTIAAMQNPTFREIVSTREYASGSRSFSNHNRMLRLYEGVDGVKTGFTKSAGRCLVSSALRGETRLIAVTLGAPNDWNDHCALFNFGFSKVCRVTRAEEGSVVATLPVISGVLPNTKVFISKELTALVDPAVANSVKLSLELPRFLYAPLMEGDTVGTAKLICGNQVLQTAPLIVVQNIPNQKQPGFFKRLFRIFS